jgi:proteasome lid subunit RPN8/RPN11
VRIPRPLHDQLERHGREGLPNESCGIVGTRDGEPTTFYPARNLFESPMRFEVHPEDVYAIHVKLEAAGEEMGVLFHTHPKTEAAPSQTDINMNAKIAEVWGPMTWLIGSLADDEFVLRGFEIDDGRAEEIELDVG